MIHEVLSVGPLQCNCSVIGDASTHEAMVVDPGGDLSKILAIVLRHSLRITQIVVTHAHIDHIAGARELNQLTGAPVYYNQLDLPLVKMMEVQAEWLGMETPDVAPPDASAEDGMVISTGNLRSEVMHTPGHTEGSICLHFPTESLLIAGDTLFAGTVGRTDLPGGDQRKLLNSIRGRLMDLPEQTKVVPGHGQLTTIGKENDTNPWMTKGPIAKS